MREVESLYCDHVSSLNVHHYLVQGEQDQYGHGRIEQSPMHGAPAAQSTHCFGIRTDIWPVAYPYIKLPKGPDSLEDQNNTDQVED